MRVNLRWKNTERTGWFLDGRENRIGLGGGVSRGTSTLITDSLLHLRIYLDSLI